MNQAHSTKACIFINFKAPISDTKLEYGTNKVKLYECSGP